MRTKAGLRLQKSLEDAIAYSKGKLPKGSYRAYALPPPVDVKALRLQMGLSQETFAARFGFNVNTLRHWEQNNRKPQGAIRAYLTVIAREPDAVRRALKLIRVE
jgi:putative transcriptional regulator